MPMRKVVFAGIAVVIIGVGVWFFFFRAPSVPPGYAKGSIADLLSLKGNLECSVALSTGSGTVEVSGGKLFGTFTESVNGQAMQAYLLSDGIDVYSWADGFSQGAELPLTAAMNASKGTLSYDCASSTPNPALFTVPAGVMFVTASST